MNRWRDTMTLAMATAIPTTSNGVLVRTFEAVFAAEERRVLGLSLRMTGNLADAQDVAQEVFLRLHRNWSALGRQSDDAIRVWLRRVTVNLCFDSHRRTKRVRLVEAEERIVDPATGVEEAALGHERSDRLLSALARLSDRERAVLVLRHFEELSTSEVAEELGVAEPTVRVHLANARVKLRRLLGETR